MNKSGGLFCTGIAFWILLVAGCTTGPTRLDRAYGTSYHVVNVSQTLQPAATPPGARLERFDGQAAQHTLDRYRESFEKPPPPPSFVISVGGIK